MAYEQKPGGGSLFKNEKKTEKAPEYQGEIVTPEGKKYRLAAWVKEGKKGKFFSLRVSEFDAKYSKQDNGDDLPF